VLRRRGVHRVAAPLHPAAIRALGSIIGGRKHRLKRLESAVIWCARNNHTYPHARAVELAKQGYFDGL
jgi:hypothetical protein